MASAPRRRYPPESPRDRRGGVRTGTDEIVLPDPAPVPVPVPVPLAAASAPELPEPVPVPVPVPVPAGGGGVTTGAMTGAGGEDAEAGRRKRARIPGFFEAMGARLAAWAAAAVPSAGGSATGEAGATRV